jgi:hypothetical protein
MAAEINPIREKVFNVCLRNIFVAFLCLCTASASTLAITRKETNT